MISFSADKNLQAYGGLPLNFYSDNNSFSMTCFGNVTMPSCIIDSNEEYGHFS